MELRFFWPYPTLLTVRIQPTNLSRADVRIWRLGEIRMLLPGSLHGMKMEIRGFQP